MGRAHDLLNYLSRTQLTIKSRLTSSTKCAAHRTTRLRRYAYGGSACSAHKDRFDLSSIGAGGPEPFARHPVLTVDDGHLIEREGQGVDETVL